MSSGKCILGPHFLVLFYFIFGHKLKENSIAKKEYNHLEQNKANEGT